MTRDDVIRMAREACGDESEDPLQENGTLILEADEFLRYSALVAAVEREACAALAIELSWKWFDSRKTIGAVNARRHLHSKSHGAEQVAEAIRARGEQ